MSLRDLCRVPGLGTLLLLPETSNNNNNNKLLVMNRINYICKVNVFYCCSKPAKNTYFRNKVNINEIQLWKLVTKSNCLNSALFVFSHVDSSSYFGTDERYKESFTCKHHKPNYHTETTEQCTASLRMAVPWQNSKINSQTIPIHNKLSCLLLATENM